MGINIYLLVATYVVAYLIGRVFRAVRDGETWAEELVTPLRIAFASAVLLGLMFATVRPMVNDMLTKGGMLELVVSALLILVVCLYPLIMLPQLILHLFAEGLSLAILVPGRHNIRMERECSKGRAAEKRGEDKLAEEIYLKALSGKPKIDFHIQLQLANLYERQKRYDEAAPRFREALKGELSAEVYLSTALRFGDLLSDRLRGREEAAEVWAAALKKYPKDPSSKGLRERLKQLAR